MIAYGSFEDVHGLTVTVEKYMQGPDDIDHFDRETMNVGRDSSVMNSSPDRRRRSSASSMQSGTLVELEEGESVGQSRPRRNSEACSRWLGNQVDNQRPVYLCRTPGRLQAQKPKL